MKLDEIQHWTRDDGFTLSTDKSYLDVEMIHNYLSREAYWSKGIHLELVRLLIKNSLCYGIYDGDPKLEDTPQVGFARVVSDFVRFAWLADVFVLPQYSGRGLGKWLVRTIIQHPHLNGVAFNLSTQDAHSLYTQFGFAAVEDAPRRMVRPLDWSLIFQGHGLK